jgi:protein required for attachment to host cells
MTKFAILTTDYTRARFFTLETAEFPLIETSPQMVEHEVLLDPELRLPGRELFSDLKSGRNRAPGGGPAHGYDDHRDQHLAELEKRFVNEVADETLRLMQEKKVDCLVVVAEEKMIGYLKTHLENAPAKTKWLAKDYSHFSAQEIHEKLAEQQLVPAPKKPAAS